jgi:hypothetical protein
VLSRKLLNAEAPIDAGGTKARHTDDGPANDETEE